MPAYLEILLDQGTDFSRDITISDDVSGANINVSGYSVHCNAKRSYSSYTRSNTVIVFNTSVTDGPNGTIQISMDSANTANIYPRRYYYDVLTISPAGIRTRVLEGILTVTPSVS